MATRRRCLPLFNRDNNANTPRACNEHLDAIDHWSTLEEGLEIPCLVRLAGQREEETGSKVFPSLGERRMEILRPL